MLIPACGGTEKPFTVNGRRWLYCYDTSLKKHCYLDLDNDIAVWHRSFHPAFAPEFEFEEEEGFLPTLQAKNKDVKPPIDPYPNFYF